MKREGQFQVCVSWWGIIACDVRPGDTGWCPLRDEEWARRFFCGEVES